MGREWRRQSRKPRSGFSPGELGKNQGNTPSGSPAKKSFSRLIFRLAGNLMRACCHSTVRVGRNSEKDRAQHRCKRIVDVTLRSCFMVGSEGCVGRKVSTAAGQHDDGLLAFPHHQAIHGFQRMASNKLIRLNHGSRDDRDLMGLHSLFCVEHPLRLRVFMVTRCPASSRLFLVANWWKSGP